MSSMNTTDETATNWLAEQRQMGRQLFLMIDGMADPDLIAALFAADLMQEYVNLYQSTDLDELADVGPWLIKLPDGLQAPILDDLMNQPQRNWGWLASAKGVALDAYVQHWRGRMVIEERGARSIYRFQDNRVLAHHLAALPDVHLPLLLGPAEAVLCWHQGAWLRFVNPAPDRCTLPLDRPWLEVPEPGHVRNGAQRHNLQQWLWQQHTDAATRLACTEPFQTWLDQQLDAARHWGWETTEQFHFLLQHRLDPALASAPLWLVQDGETPDQHYQRCQQAIARLQRSHT